MLFSFFQNVHETKKNIGEPEHVYSCSDDDDDDNDNDADNKMMKKVMTMTIIYDGRGGEDEFQSDRK